MVLKYLITDKLWIVKHEFKLSRMTQHTSKDKVGELHFGMQDEECLNASKQNMCWAPCLILSIARWVITSRDILKNNWRMKRILDEPPCRVSMKNSGNKRMIKRKRSWKCKVKPCDDLDGASRRCNRGNLELRKEKMNILEPRITSSWTISEEKNWITSRK